MHIFSQLLQTNSAMQKDIEGFAKNSENGDSQGFPSLFSGCLDVETARESSVELQNISQHNLTGTLHSNQFAKENFSFRILDGTVSLENVGGEDTGQVFRLVEDAGVGMKNSGGLQGIQDENLESFHSTSFSGREFFLGDSQGLFFKAAVLGQEHQSSQKSLDASVVQGSLGAGKSVATLLRGTEDGAEMQGTPTFRESGTDVKDSGNSGLFTSFAGNVAGQNSVEMHNNQGVESSATTLHTQEGQSSSLLAEMTMDSSEEHAFSATMPKEQGQELKAAFGNQNAGLTGFDTLHPGSGDVLRHGDDEILVGSTSLASSELSEEVRTPQAMNQSLLSQASGGVSTKSVASTALLTAPTTTVSLDPSAGLFFSQTMSDDGGVARTLKSTGSGPSISENRYPFNRMATSQASTADVAESVMPQEKMGADSGDGAPIVGTYDSGTRSQAMQVGAGITPRSFVVPQSFGENLSSATSSVLEGFADLSNTTLDVPEKTFGNISETNTSATTSLFPGAQQNVASEKEYMPGTVREPTLSTSQSLKAEPGSMPDTLKTALNDRVVVSNTDTMSSTPTIAGQKNLSVADATRGQDMMSGKNAETQIASPSTSAKDVLQDPLRTGSDGQSGMSVGSASVVSEAEHFVGRDTVSVGDATRGQDVVSGKNAETQIASPSTSAKGMLQDPLRTGSDRQSGMSAGSASVVSEAEHFAGQNTGSVEENFRAQDVVAGKDTGTHIPSQFLGTRSGVHQTAQSNADSSSGFGTGENVSLNQNGSSDQGKDFSGKRDDSRFQEMTQGKTLEGSGVKADAAEGLTDGSVRSSLAFSKEIQENIRGLEPQVETRNALSRNVLDQVEKGAFQNLGQGRKQLALQLNPGDLGSVQVILQVKGKDVSAVLKTSKEDTSRILGDQMVQLKENLEKQGLRVTRLEVQQQAVSEDRSGQWGGTSEHNQSQERFETTGQNVHWRSLKEDGQDLAREMQDRPQQVKTSLGGVDFFA